MPYLASLDVNLQQLQGCHRAIIDEVNLYTGDLEHYQAEFTIDSIDEEEFITLKKELSGELAKHKLENHLNNFLYLGHLQLEDNAPDYLFQEELYLHASRNIKQLIKLINFKELSRDKDISISLKNKTNNDLTITFETQIAISHVWDDLYNRLVKSLTDWSGNHIIKESLGNGPLTKAHLLTILQKLRTRKNAFWNKSLANFCRMIIYYMQQNNVMSSESLSEQARFLYNLLRIFKFVNDDDIDSDSDDYIRSLLRNNQ